MKPRPTWTIAAFLLVVLLSWIAFTLFNFSKGHPETTTERSRPTPLPTALQYSTTVNAPTTPDLSVYRTDPKWIWWNKQSERDRNFEWKMPISFYGKVIDQDDQPLEGVEVILQWTDMSAKGSSERTIFTDSDGRFELSGVSGKRLGVNQVFKRGYYRVNKGIPTSFEYAAFFESNYHKADARNPVVFRLRKQGEIPDELIVRETMMGIDPNGTPLFIDLGTTRKSGAEMGDISVRITRTAPKGLKRFDWRADIGGINGAGLLESDAEFMFEAPNDGYKSGYTYEFIQSSPDWKNNLRKQYYVTCNGGKLYCRLEVEFMPKYQNTAAIAIRFFVNPTGSRNLEYQPNKVLPQ